MLGLQSVHLFSPLCLPREPEGGDRCWAVQKVNCRGCMSSEAVLNIGPFSKGSSITFQEWHVLHWMQFWWADRSGGLLPTMESGGDRAFQLRANTAVTWAWDLCWAKWENSPWLSPHQGVKVALHSHSEALGSHLRVYCGSYLLSLWACKSFPVPVSFLLN